MRLSDLKSLDQVVEEHRQEPEFREEWDRLAFAHEVANRVVAYRAEHNLSQRRLATLVGLVQPAIARLEKAEHQPSFDTLPSLRSPPVSASVSRYLAEASNSYPRRRPAGQQRAGQLRRLRSRQTCEPPSLSSACQARKRLRIASAEAASTA
jgi:transcriptional regulator with XRE-family HTH domain